ncbi:MAG: hypothetical protein AAGA54_21945 [Myxococcota bacterium]
MDLVRVAALVLLSCSGCSASEDFRCVENSECSDDGRAGMCQPTGYCSFPDEDCASGQRYGDLAAEGLGGKCVPADTADGSSSGVEPSATTSGMGTTSGTSNVPETSTGSSSSADVSGSTGGVTGAETTSSSTDASDSTSTGADDMVLTVDELMPGDLVITEIMLNPNCPADVCEWLEVYNATQFSVDLLGLGVGDADDVIDGAPGAIVSVSVLLLPGEVGVLAQQTWPYTSSPDPLAFYGGVAFTNGSIEGAALFGEGIVLDETALFFAADSPDDGRAIALASDSWAVDANDDADNWCWSDVPLPSKSFADDWGTPGSDEVVCVMQ